MVATWDMILWLDDVDVVDHVALGQARLIWQYRGSQPRLQGCLAAYLTQIQSIDDVSMEVLAGRWPLTAIGDQLDTLGKIVGQARGTFTDDQYRLFILARILVNKSKGRAVELGEIMEILGFPTIYIWEHYPAEIHVSVAGADFGDLIGELLTEAKTGGAMLRYTFSDEDSDDVFQFANVLGSGDNDADSGFGDLGETTQTTGGYWSGGTTT